MPSPMNINKKNNSPVPMNINGPVVPMNINTPAKKRKTARRKTRKNGDKIVHVRAHTRVIKSKSK